MLTALLLILLLASPVAEAGQPTATAAGPEGCSPLGELLRSVCEVLQRENRRIGTVGIIELRGFPPQGPRKYAALAWGVRPDRRFQGDFRDELFAVLVIDAGLKRVEKVLAIVPSPRWLDYSFRFTAVTVDKIEVHGVGATYGDDPRDLQFAWNPFE